MATILREASVAPGASDITIGLWLFVGLLAAHVAVARWLPRVVPSHHVTGATEPPLPLAPVLVLLIVGLAARLPGLNGGLWFDEIQTLVEYVRLPWSVLLTTFDSTNQHFLFSIAARAVRTVGGESAAMLRLPAAIFGVLSLWATVAFGRRWLPTREAWWSGVLLAVSYHHIWFSQNARGYTGLLLGTLLASSLMLDMLRETPVTRRQVWSYALVVAFTLLTHITALVVVAGHGVCWLVWLRTQPRGIARWAPGVALVLGGTVAMMLYAPVLPQLVGALGSSGTGVTGAEWQRPGWFLAEAIAGLIRGVPAGALVLPVTAVVVLAGLHDAWRHHRLAAIMMVLPLVMMAALLLSTGHNMWPRFFFFGAAFVVQWAVHGGFVVLARVLPRAGTRIGDLGLSAVTLASLLLLPRAWAPKQDYPAALTWLAEARRPTDPIAGTEMMDLPMNLWLGQQWPIIRTVGELQSLEAGTPATWVVTTFRIRLESTAPALASYLDSAYTVAHVIPASIGGGEVRILRRRPAIR
ncbi:MAG: glycosyltransferase family 39 protein [Gemmatimonadales bacterium]|nr:glycosyltransferase family 39 protein [Gemmatimonadales bacterium]